MGLPGLAEQLRFARERAGLSKAALARAAGVDGSTPTKWESGERQPQLDNLEKVAAACHHRLVVTLIPESAALVAIETTPEIARLAEAAAGLSADDIETLVDLAARLGAL